MTTKPKPTGERTPEPPRPTRFIVGSMRWKLDWGTISDHVLGRSNETTLRVQVDDSNPPDVQRLSLLHELIHVCSFTTMKGKQELSEAQVHALTAVLYDLLRRNPEVVAWLLAQTSEGGEA